MIGISSIYHDIFEKRTPVMPRTRFVKYYQDLHALYDAPLAEESFKKGSQYSYTELGTRILQQCRRDQILDTLDFLVIATWAHEFDPEYGTCGAFFSHHFQLKAKVFDICDQGTLSVSTGLFIIQKFLQQNPNKNGMLLIMEQTSIPHSADFTLALPGLDAAAAIFCQAEKNNHLCRIIDVQQFSENQSLRKFLVDRFIPPDDLQIIIKDRHHYGGLDAEKYFSDVEIKKIPHLPSCIQSLIHLKHSLAVFPAKRFIALIEKDEESTDFSCLLMERIK